MVTGKSTEAKTADPSRHALRISAEGSRRFRVSRLQTASTWMALGGWFPAAGRDV